MQKFYYGTGNTNNLDLLCDVLFSDIPDTNNNLNLHNPAALCNNLVVNYCCENLYNKKCGNENNLNYDCNNTILKQQVSPNNMHIKKSMKFINRNLDSITDTISNYSRNLETENVFLKTTPFQPIHHKQILSSMFKPIKNTCLTGLEEKEIVRVFMRAVRFGIKNNEKVSIRYLCVYVLLLNDCGMQLKRIYEGVLNLCPNIKKEINWKGRIRYSLSLYPQFEKMGQVNGTGSAIWSFKLQ